MGRKGGPPRERGLKMMIETVAGLSSQIHLTRFWEGQSGQCYNGGGIGGDFKSRERCSKHTDMSEYCSTKLVKLLKRNRSGGWLASCYKQISGLSPCGHSGLIFAWRTFSTSVIPTDDHVY
jgi:hypothetical protein